jgi:hypothetical protein
MPSSPLHNYRDNAHLLGSNPMRIARAAVLNGLPISPRVAAMLEAQGINVGELEQRIRQNMEFTR